MSDFTLIILPDPVYKVWPNNRRSPCSIAIPEEQILAYYTSLPYPVQIVDAMGNFASVQSLSLEMGYIEALGTDQAEVTAMSLREILKNYSTEPEALGTDQAEVTALNMRTIVKGVSVEPEALGTDQAEVTALDMRTILIRYQNYEPEGFTTQAAVTAINLS